MTYNILDNLQKLNQLDWQALLAHFKQYCFFDHTFQEFSDLSYSQKQIESVYDSIDKMQNTLVNIDTSHLIEEIASLDSDISLYTLVGALKKHAYFDTQKLNSLINCIEFILNNNKIIEKSGIDSALFENQNELNQLRQCIKKDFRSFVLKDGHIDYFKHPKLKLLYKGQLDTEKAIRSAISRIVQEPQFRNTLQFQGHDIVNERYVIAIKSDNYQYVLGSIISRSESGRTLYIEPHALKELNSKRLEYINNIKVILDSLFRTFIDNLTPFNNLLHSISRALYKFDSIYSRLKFSSSFRLNRPKIINEPSIFIEDFFHPLIENPITNIIDLDKNSAGLILSGPNTGGKTATIKSLILCQVFMHKGLFIPARSAQLYLFNKIFYFANDNQSIEEGLSSFSAEVKNYSQLLDQLDSSNLIVIDEIFNSTSSEEASALAIGFFDEFLKNKNTKVIVSTHHQTLKSMMHTKSDYLSAHVGFDKETNKPTYKIHYGIPGASQALEIFKSLTSDKDFSQNILKKAYRILDKKMINYESLLEKISQKESNLNKLINENTQLNKEAINIKESAKGLAALKVSEDVEKARKSIKKIEDEMLETLKKIKDGDIKSKSSIFNKSTSSTSKLNQLDEIKKSNKPSKDYSNMSAPRQLICGKKYFSTFLAQTVTLQKIQGKKAFVSKGALSISCPIESLMESNLKTAERSVSNIIFNERNIKLEYDCRGMRLEEFQNLVHTTVSDLLAGLCPYIIYIHGHGTGILKRWIRDYIRNNKQVELKSSETGNDGETQIILSQ